MLIVHPPLLWYLRISNWPLRRGGSWGYLAGSLREATSHLDCRVQSVLFHSDRLCKGIEKMAFTGQSKKLHILAGISSLDILYLEGKSPLLMSNIQVNFGDVLPESSKSSAFWDMGVDSHLKLLLLFSPMKHASRTAPVYFLFYCYFDKYEDENIFTRCFSQYYEYTQYHNYHIYNLDIRA